MLFISSFTWEWVRLDTFGGNMEPFYHPGAMLFLGLLAGAGLQGAKRSEMKPAMAETFLKLLPVVIALIAMLSLSQIMVHAGTAYGGFGNQRDEGSLERGPQFERAGRLVDRRAHRGSDRLVHRRPDPGKGRESGPLPGCPIVIRQAGTCHCSPFLSRSGTFHGHDGLLHRHQRVFF